MDNVPTDPAGDEATRLARGARSREIMGEAGLQLVKAMDGVQPSGNGAPDPFAPLPAGGPTAVQKPEPEVWEPELPAPCEPPEAADIKLPPFGTAVCRWVYRDGEGRPLFAVARFESTKPDGTTVKETRPFTYGRRAWTTKAGRKPGSRMDCTGWHCEAPPAPRALYGLDRLAARPGAPALMCEGEKAADAAGLLFPDHVAIASQGGALATSKSDWTPLAGRTVTFWPDRDAPGQDYAREAAGLAAAAGADPVHIVSVPDTWPEGWDLADPLPPNVPAVTLGELLAAAEPAGPALELPPGFFVSQRGLFFQAAPPKDKEPPPPTFVAGRFTVLGEARNDVGNAWGLLLRWQDRDGHTHQWSVPKRLVHADGNAIAAELEDAGLECAADGRGHSLLKDFISQVRAPRRMRCVDRIGWHVADRGDVFVLPGGEAFGPGAGSIVLQAERATADAAYRAAGTLAGWQENVAKLAVGNDRLALFISAAFAGPLLDVAAEPSGGVHLVGKSRSGKTSCLYTAGSVWGRGDEHGQVRAWRSTTNGLEGVAAETSDTVLILDELGQADARDVGDAVYMLSNQSGKSRAGRGGEARQRRTWRTLFLSSGEVPLASKMAEAGKKPMAGLDVRLASLPVDAGAGLGAFQELHGRPTPGAFADHLRAASRTDYGHAGRAYLARLVADRAADAGQLRSFVRQLRDGFLAQQVPAGADGQVRSVAGRFALIGAAGELARDYGVLPWPEGEALRAAEACFTAWLAARGGSGASEDAQAIAQVRAFIEAHGESRFTSLSRDDRGGWAPPPETRTMNRAGFRERIGTGEDARWHFYILPETWAVEVCRGLDPRRAASALLAAGLLVPGEGKHLARRQSLPDLGRPRIYDVKGEAIGGDDAE